MALLLSHWHCILPVIGILVAGVFLREKPKKGAKIEKKVDPE
jgi:thiol:disulfide interchange protein